MTGKQHRKRRIEATCLLWATFHTSTAAYAPLGRGVAFIPLRNGPVGTNSGTTPAMRTQRLIHPRHDRHRLSAFTQTNHLPNETKLGPERLLGSTDAGHIYFLQRIRTAGSLHLCHHPVSQQDCFFPVFLVRTPRCNGMTDRTVRMLAHKRSGSNDPETFSRQKRVQFLQRVLIRPVAIHNHCHRRCARRP